MKILVLSDSDTWEDFDESSIAEIAILTPAGAEKLTDGVSFKHLEGGDIAKRIPLVDILRFVQEHPNLFK